MIDPADMMESSRAGRSSPIQERFHRIRESAPDNTSPPFRFSDDCRITGELDRAALSCIADVRGGLRRQLLADVAQDDRAPSFANIRAIAAPIPCAAP